MSRMRDFIHFVIVVLLIGAALCGTLCQANETEVPNISRITPEDLLEKDKAILEKYKEIARQKFSRYPSFVTASPTPVTTSPTTGITRIPTPTAQETPAVSGTPTPVTSNESGPIATESGRIFTDSIFFTTLFTLGLIGGGILLHLSLFSKDIHAPVGLSPCWHPVRQVFMGAHAFMAATFLLQAVAFIGSLLIWNGFSWSGISWIIIGGFLLIYGAVSSAGMAYSSFLGRVMKLAPLAHLILSACGFLVFAIPGLLPDLPFTPLFPAITFLCSLCIVLIQVYSPRNAPAGPAAAFTDTMLYEEEPPVLTPPFPPELEHRYTEARFLHQGGIARVFSARRRNDGVMVAVKVPIKADEQTGRSLLREMGVWKTLTHPGIVQVYAVNILPVPYVEMEYLPSTLTDLPIPMDPCRTVDILRKIALAVAFAHERGVIHRDLKPGNILMTSDGDPKVGDWGLSRDDSIPAETTLHGFSLSYAAPEQLDPARFGRTTQQTDIYQLGIILFQLLTGVLPFSGESIAEITRERLGGEIKAASTRVPSAGAFDAIIRTCLAVEPADRYQTVGDFIADLDACRAKICGPQARSGMPGEGGVDGGPSG